VVGEVLDLQRDQVPAVKEKDRERLGRGTGAPVIEERERRERRKGTRKKGKRKRVKERKQREWERERSR
jgi:hypothetical protein